jgi:hypothetical protein
VRYESGAMMECQIILQSVGVVEDEYIVQPGTSRAEVGSGLSNHGTGVNFISDCPSLSLAREARGE